jgi:uncharacterized membrane protein YqjE
MEIAMIHSIDEAGAVELVRGATEDSLELVRLELALARDELRDDLLAMRSSVILGAMGFVCTLLGIALLFVALGVALGPSGALLLGGVLLVTAAVLGFVAWKRFPSRPLAATTRRMQSDRRMLTEHLS